MVQIQAGSLKPHLIHITEEEKDAAQPPEPEPIITPQPPTPVKCISKEMRKVIRRFLKNRARFYGRVAEQERLIFEPQESDVELENEYYRLLTVFNNIPPCTPGNPELASLPWLRKRGAARESLEKAGGIHRLPTTATYKTKK